MDLSGLPGRLLSGAIVLLVAAWALSAAVQLITSIWVPLVIVAGLGAAIAAVVVWYRKRLNGW